MDWSKFCEALAEQLVTILSPCALSDEVQFQEAVDDLTVAGYRAHSADGQALSALMPLVERRAFAAQEGDELPGQCVVQIPCCH